MLSGNRMPLILFLFGLLLVFLFNNKLRKIIPVSLICLFILFKFILSSDKTMEGNYQSMYGNIQGIVGIFVLEPISKNDSEKNYETQGSSTMVTKKDQQSPLHRIKISFLN